MKAVVVTKPGVIEIQDIPLPQIGPREALVRIEACGLCGTTDRHIVEGRQAHHPADAYPAVLGHESVGTVVEIGREVRSFRLGDRVTRPVAIWPGTTRYGLHSAWGGFAEFGIVRDCGSNEELDYTARRQHRVPEELSLEEAVAAVSFSEVSSWMEKLGSLEGKIILIGGTGFAACVMTQVARSKRAGQIIAFGKTKAKFARVLENGANEVLMLRAGMTEEIRDRTHGQMADWFLDAAGHPEVFEAGLRALKVGGNAAIYGAPEGFSYRLPLGSCGGDFSVHYLIPQDDLFFQQTCQQIRRGALRTSSVITHKWHGLESLPGALADQKEGRVLKGMVVICEKERAS